MPTYLYACPSCSTGFDVIKSMKDLDRAEPCPACERVCSSKDRQIQAANFTGAGDWNTQTYNPALGCVTRNNRHAQKIAKERGYIEVGTEKPEAIHRHFETKRKEIREERWAEAARDKVYGD